MNTNFLNSVTNFLKKRTFEFLGLILIFTSIGLTIAFTTYSPEDPNFIFSNDIEIQNILGFRGSFIADVFFQSLGLISLLFSISIFFNGVNIIKSKKILNFIENLFYTIIYSLFGAIFFSIFYKTSFWLSINGNGGFIGKFLENSFL